MDPARQITKLLETAFEMVSRPGENGPRGGRVKLDPSVQHRQLESRRHQSLLRPIVQITLDPASRVVRGLDQPCARSGELLPRFSVRDRVRDQLGEGSHTILGAHRHHRSRRPARR
jgi:hypothetical protein